jgi:hypothetical protein
MLPSGPGRFQFQAYGLLTEDSNARCAPKESFSVARHGAVHLDVLAAGLSCRGPVFPGLDSSLQMLRLRPC